MVTKSTISSGIVHKLRSFMFNLLISSTDKDNELPYIDLSQIKILHAKYEDP